ncbi:sensor histidine kinase [Flavobacterium jejuense]|uniref:histidine kinase n=1 Tax=Flavobacterium jejuense TaxID=1544455 RepID=A0ABX0IMZ0_9FLAO|nr:sensor histidine kinase [Flavobacterium jejuense]NHN24963.1 sensor histidine kinase [Flavobacterium jejuense]
MKVKLLLPLLLVSISIFAQKENAEQKKKQLETAIQKAQGAKRLKLLDSLANYIYHDTNLECDSILRATMSYAIELDSADVATRQASNLIDYIAYTSRKFEEGKQIIATMSPLLEKVSAPNILDNYYTNVANMYYYAGDFDASINAYDKAASYATQYNSTTLGFIAFRKGIVYVDKGEFGKASLALTEAINSFQKEKDTLKWIDAKGSMSILYSKSGFYKESKKEREEQIELAKRYKPYSNIGVIYFNMAADYNKVGLQAERIANLKLALKNNETSQHKVYFEPIFRSALAVAYAENDSIALAEKIVKELEANPEQYTTHYNEAFYLEAKKSLLFSKKEYKQAIAYGDTYLKLKQKGKQFEEIQLAEKFLYDVYEQIGDKEKALYHFKNYTHIKDSIGSIQKTRVLAYYQTLYETEKRDLIIENQEANIALLDSKNKIMNQWLLFGGLSLLTLFGFLSIIRSRNFAKKKQKIQEKFTQDIINAQEEERTRVALELHDSVGQQLMLITRKSKNSNDTSIEALAKDTLQNVRTISQGLHPVVLERLGFTAGINDLITTIDTNTALFFTTEIENVDAYLNNKEALHLYRIQQEILNNIVKHAEATAVSIDIRKEKSTIEIIVEDNGKGFDYEKQMRFSKSLGMKSLLERSKILKANLTINSILKKGTITQVTFPIG